MRSQPSLIGLRLVLIVVALATIGCDRVTKQMATATLAGAPGRSWLADTVRLEYAENAGGFLSLGATWPSPARTALFTIGTGALLVVLMASVWRWRGGLWPMLGLTLFVAGAGSNWLDRLIRGSVIDFLNVGVGPLRTGIFNVADVAIIAGAGLFLLAHTRAPDNRERPVQPATGPAPGR